MTRIPVFFLGLLLCSQAFGQRRYSENSVLATGDWYQIAVPGPGIYKVDGAFLAGLGISLPIPSSAIRLYGNGGGMLPEDNAVSRPDDLLENAIFVEDGGDGSFSATDHFLFHAEGPEKWTRDSITRSFSHVKNLYSGEAYYYVTVGGQGSRIPVRASPAAANLLVQTFDERYAYELDSLNFLSSGKQWYGEEFGTGPGQLSSRNFNVSLPGLVSGSQVTIVSDVIGRSVGQSARFDVSLNAVPVHRHTLPALSGVTYEPVATASQARTTVGLSGSGLTLGFIFTPGSLNAQGWLNWFEVMCTRNLDMSGLSQLRFRHWSGITSGATAEYLIRNTGSPLRIWDITDPLTPVAMTVTASGSDSRFRNDCSRIREYIAFTGSGFPAPRPAGKLRNQNLHRQQNAAMIILTTAALMDQASRLAEHHRVREGLVSVVADVAQVFHEFSSGTPDPVALRDFVKMFYDRAGTDTLRRPRYLLLFGDASFDYRKRVNVNTSLVPAWQSPNSLEPLNTHTSDDFFGLLDDAEDINNQTGAARLDIGIGRIPAETAAEARIIVDKIINYHAPASLGPWRNQVSFVADDEDQNLHLNDAELHAGALSALAPAWNQQKTYLDAFRQESGSGGSRYPQVNASINSRIYSGTLLWNYSGHGGSRRLAQEAILDEDMVDSWRNDNRLALFVTATCDFAPYDNPLVKSIGEKILLGRPSGGIALMTTTRLVFAFSNRVMNNNYLRAAFQPKPDGSYLSLGEAVRQAKNFTYQTSGDVINNRKFTLLGDPALTLGFPAASVRTLTINGRPLSSFTDTLRALNRYTVTGEVTDLAGSVLTGFNGTVYPSVYDKQQTQTTLGNDPGSQVVNFSVRQNPLYNGRLRVVNGRFSFTFVVPKDINYGTGKGRISYYADNGMKEANGHADDIFIGGLGNEVKDDGAGPGIRAYLNDEKFVNGGIANEAPVLILKLSDSTGINTSGTGIGHNITAVLDDNTRETIVLNDFFETDPDSDRKGTVRYQLPRLEEGQHRIMIRAWDVFNNSSEHLLEFSVVKKEALALNHVLNYPNPFTTRTRFWFEHNRPGEDLRVELRIMTVTGRIVRTLSQTIRNDGNRSDDLEWDGLDDYGARLGRGVYLYRIRVITGDGRSAEKTEKLLIL